MSESLFDMSEFMKKDEPTPEQAVTVQEEAKEDEIPSAPELDVQKAVVESLAADKAEMAAVIASLKAEIATLKARADEESGQVKDVVLSSVFDGTHSELALKIFILNNNGYHSIRQTQTNLFQPPLVGVCDGNGLSFPSMEKIAYAYGIPYEKIDMLAGVAIKVQRILNMEGPVLCEVILDPEQNFEPKLSSNVLPDGKIVSPEIDDMYPFLPREEYERNKL